MNGKLRLFALNVFADAVQKVDFHFSLDFVFVDVENLRSCDYNNALLCPVVLVDLFHLVRKQHRL